MGELNPFNYACGGKEWRAWDKGHAVGKVEGSEETLETVRIFVEKKLRRPVHLHFDDDRIIVLVKHLEALRKPEGGG